MLSVHALVATLRTRPGALEGAKCDLGIGEEDGNANLADYSFVFAVLALVAITALTRQGIAFVELLNQIVRAI